MIRTRTAHAHFLRGFALLLFLAASGAVALADGETAPARDPKQPVDDAYTAKIKKYTTQPFFTSPLVDYLPASKTVPTPAPSTVRATAQSTTSLGHLPALD